MGWFSAFSPGVGIDLWFAGHFPKGRSSAISDHGGISRHAGVLATQDSSKSGGNVIGHCVANTDALEVRKANGPMLLPHGAFWVHEVENRGEGHRPVVEKCGEAFGGLVDVVG